MRIIRKCPICKSTDLEYLARAKWNESEQKFEIIYVEDGYPYCPNCGEHINEDIIEITNLVKVL